MLLRLVERSHLAITDVSLVAVTTQFLIYVAELNRRDAELIADFSSVGSRLVVLKSRSLLPRPPIEDAEQVSDLARELIEYRAVKETATLLAERDIRGAGTFPIANTTVPNLNRIALRPLAAHQPVQLARALRRRLLVVPVPALIVTARKLVSLREMAERVLTGLQHTGTATFHSITHRCDNVHEARTAFLAVLVLVRRQIIDVDQPHMFGEITIRRLTPIAGPADYLTGFSSDD